MTKGYALITGACSGIGLEIARELARRGYPLLMVSNHEAELTAAAEELAAEYGVDAQTIEMDLARPEAARELHETVADLGVEVEILVSNAGIFFFGEVVDADPARAAIMMQLHVVTPSLLAHFFGHDMAARGSGHIVFVSSISAWRDFPGIAYYSSSKRFLRSFASALREELRDRGVSVTCVAPGAVATNLYQDTKIPVQVAVKYGVMKDPSGVARAAVQGMSRGRAVVVPGLSAKAMALGMTVMPRWMIRLIHRRKPFARIESLAREECPNQGQA
ncbi:MAG: SDR family NAD(P)-dependent oxidoreductase [Thermoleophilia bacterium]|nr:SDR family NAD(P)-dependent oxidoreductase [Thermoleophilia bacterium]